MKLSNILVILVALSVTALPSFLQNNANLLINRLTPRTPDTDRAEPIHWIVNWIGNIIPPPRPEDKFIWAFTSFYIPKIELDYNGPDGENLLAAWVGIDGSYGSPDLIQAGFAWKIDKRGDVINVNQYAFYEWYPAPAVAISASELDFSIGDRVAIYITIQSPTNATFELRNVNTGKNISHSLTPPTDAAKWQGDHVNWIVEEQYNNGVHLANFTRFSFNNCRAGIAGRDDWKADMRTAKTENGGSSTDVVIRGQGEFDVVFKH
jgi:hypothetical protein